MLKSLERINIMINENQIKRIFIADAWDKAFVNKINELFGDKVEIYELRYNIKILDGIRLYKTDCVLFYETVITNRNNRNNQCTDSILNLAYMCGAFVKILTEDIYCDDNVKASLDDI